jgi:hypothetical protein
LNRSISLILILLLVVFEVWACVRVWRNRRNSPGPSYWLVEDVRQFDGKPTDELVTIGRFRNPLDAEAHRLRLETAGIDCSLLGDILARTRGPEMGIPFVIPTELRVRAEDAQRALDELRRVGA